MILNQEQTMTLERIWIFEFLQCYWWIGVILIVLILVLVYLLSHRRREKNIQTATMARKIKQSVCSSDDDVVTLQDNVNGAVKLVLYQKGKKVSEMDIVVADSLIIGRSDLSDVYLEGSQLSRQHFALEFDGQHYYIEDLQTTNGTLLNGRLIQGRSRLNKNDKIKIGSLEIVIRW